MNISIRISVLLFIPIFRFSAPVFSQVKVKGLDTVEARPPDVQPQFPGSVSAFMRDNVVYPDDALEEGAEGTVYVRFIVSQEGKIQDARIEQSSGNNLLDAEALRVVKKMPIWIPGKLDGRAVRTYFRLPVAFRLAE